MTRKEAEDFVKKIICYTLGTTTAVGILIGVILGVISILSSAI